MLPGHDHRRGSGPPGRGRRTLRWRSRSEDPRRSPLVVLDQVNKHFGDLHVLKDVDLTVHRGEVVVILGPSGSGKSTLCRTINRLEPIDSGTITLDGRPLPVRGQGAGPAALRGRHGVPVVQPLRAQDGPRQNVTLGPMKVRGLGKAAPRSAPAAAGPGGHRRARPTSCPAQLSGGQQQRVAIARALAMEPKVILFDEPTSALDPEMINEVLDVMTRLARDGMTMVVVTHEMGFARRAADRVVFMDDGASSRRPTPRVLRLRPPATAAKDFLSKILSHCERRDGRRTTHRYDDPALAGRRLPWPSSRPAVVTTTTALDRRVRPGSARRMAKLSKARRDHDRHQVRPAGDRLRSRADEPEGFDLEIGKIVAAKLGIEETRSSGSRRCPPTGSRSSSRHRRHRRRLVLDHRRARRRRLRPVRTT